jgi:hypothetical protein
MKAIQIKKTEKFFFQRAARIVGVDAQELSQIRDKTYCYFFIVTHSQDLIFKLGAEFHQICLEHRK